MLLPADLHFTLHLIVDYIRCPQVKCWTMAVCPMGIVPIFYSVCNRGENSGFDNAAIKADFEELYRLMNGKPLKEIDEIIYAVCTLCRDQEKAGFIEGIKGRLNPANELNTLLIPTT